MSEITTSNILNGKLKIYQGRSGIREDLKEYGFIRSAFEANMIRYLLFKNEIFEYQVPILLNNDRWYTCDFYLPNRNKLFLETKGYLREEARIKYELLQKDYPHMNWRILMQKSIEWKNIIKEYAHQIPNWEFYKNGAS